MYGSTNRSWMQRWTVIAGECICLLIAYWFLFMGGNEALHLPEGHYDRQVALFAVCLVTFLRMSFMVLYLLRRGLRWGEAGGVLFAFAAYYIGFCLLGGTQGKPLDGLDLLAILLFAAGSIVNTASEWLRDRWKREPRNKGKLYTGGLFKYATHVNYFGDIVWVGGIAMLTRNPWAALVPFFLILMFVFLNIPQHDRYLRDRYGSAFIEYEKKTKKLIPFVY